MVSRRPRGQASVEFLAIMSFLTAIGIYLMSTLATQDSSGNSTTGSVEGSAMTAIQND